MVSDQRNSLCDKAFSVPLRFVVVEHVFSLLVGVASVLVEVPFTRNGPRHLVLLLAFLVFSRCHSILLLEALLK